MPLFIYHPEGIEPREWDVDFGKIMSPERIAIEKLTEGTWNDFQRGIFGDRSAAVHALLYVLLKRERPTLRPSDVQFCGEDYTLDISEREARFTIKNMRAARPEALDADDEKLLAVLLERFPDPEPELEVVDALEAIEAAEFPKAANPA